MKKGFAFLAIVLIAIVALYSSLNFGNEQANKTEYTDVSLIGGGTIKLTPEEAQLTAGVNEKKAILTNLGMFWTSCEAAVAATLKKTEGITSSYVNLEKDRATVVYQPNVVTMDEIKQSIIDVGYQVGDVKEVQ